MMLQFQVQMSPPMHPSTRGRPGFHLEPPGTVGRVLYLPSESGACAWFQEQVLFRWLSSSFLPGDSWLPAVIVADTSQMPLHWRLRSDPRRQLPYVIVAPIWEESRVSGVLECKWMLWLTWDVTWQQWRLRVSNSFNPMYSPPFLLLSSSAFPSLGAPPFLR